MERSLQHAESSFLRATDTRPRVPFSPIRTSLGKGTKSTGVHRASSRPSDRIPGTAQMCAMKRAQSRSLLALLPFVLSGSLALGLSPQPRVPVGEARSAMRGALVSATALGLRSSAASLSDPTGVWHLRPASESPGSGLRRCPADRTLLAGRDHRSGCPSMMAPERIRHVERHPWRIEGAGPEGTVLNRAGTPMQQVPNIGRPDPKSVGSGQPRPRLQGDALVVSGLIVVCLVVLAVLAARLGGTLRGGQGRAEPNGKGAGTPFLGAPPDDRIDLLRAADESHTIPLSHDLLVSSEGFVIGRNPAICHVEIQDESVANRHVRIRRVRGMLWIEDLNSATGTSLDDTVVEPFMPTVASNGQVLRIGTGHYLLALAGDD